jgi:hypothetical protein
MVIAGNALFGIESLDYLTKLEIPPSYGELELRFKESGLDQLILRTPPKRKVRRKIV